MAAFHEAAHVVVGIRARAVVGRKHRAHVGVHHEAREDPQHVTEVVRAARAATLGVGHRDHAVDPGGSPGRGPLHDPAHESVGARGGGQHHDEVSGAHPAAPGAAESVEGGAGVGGLDLPARRERRLVQCEGLDGIREVRGRRQLEVDVAFGERGQDLRVARVLPGVEVAGRDAERKAPRVEAGSVRDGCAHEPVSFEHGVGEAELALPVRDDGARLEAARRDGDVVARRGHAGHLVEFETIGHRVLSGSVRRVRRGHVQLRRNADLG